MKKTRNESHYGMQYGIKEVIAFLRQQYRALTERNIGFIDLFDDYEQYWTSGDVIPDMNIGPLIKDWLDPGSTILDAGVGPGLISEYLMKSRNVKIVGLDISNAACKMARQRGIMAEARDITNGLGLNINEFYDYILLTEVIHQTAYPHRILVDAIRHSKKGVIVTIPNSAYITYRIQLLRGYAPRQPFVVLHLWSIKDFKLYCERLNIRTLDFKTFLPKYLLKFKNLLGFQQAWLLAPEKMENRKDHNLNKEKDC